jgi:hypothetical protein
MEIVKVLSDHQQKIKKLIFIVNLLNEIKSVFYLIANFQSHKHTFYYNFLRCSN